MFRLYPDGWYYRTPLSNNWVGPFFHRSIAVTAFHSSTIAMFHFIPATEIPVVEL